MTNLTLTSNAADETFSISTSTALFTLKSELDYEAVKAYYFLMTVVDQGTSLTGSIALRVRFFEPLAAIIFLSFRIYLNVDQDSHRLVS